MGENFNKRGEGLDDTTAADHALVVGMAALQAVPAVGGIIATFISEYVPRRKQTRLVDFVTDLGREFEAVRDRVDREFVRTAEFHGMVEEVLNRVQERKNEQKLAYWAALLAGIARTDRPSSAERERMIEALDALRASHLQLLHVISTTTQGRPGLYAGGISDTLQWKMPGIPIDEIRRDWEDLARWDLVQTYPSGMMTAEGAGNLSVRVTPYGLRFIEVLKVGEMAV